MPALLATIGAVAIAFAAGPPRPDPQTAFDASAVGACRASDWTDPPAAVLERSPPDAAVNGPAWRRAAREDPFTLVHACPDRRPTT
jgi:hypothetical protein